MKLEVQDRITFCNLFPNIGSIADQQMVRELQKKIAFKVEEVKDISLTQDKQGNFTWNKPLQKEVAFNDKELKFLKNQVNILNKEKKVTGSILDLCLKIKEHKV